MNVNDTQGGTQDGTQGGTQGGTQDKLQKQIFDMIEENPQISTSEIATRLGVGVRTVKRRIKQMQNATKGAKVLKFDNNKITLEEEL